MKILNIPNQIIKEPLQPLNLKKIDSIALHHMDCDNDVKSIELMHINKGWKAIGYNFWVGFDGTIYEGRGFNIGAGVEGQNGHVISIGFQGDYHSKDRFMPNEQFNSGIDIIGYILAKCPNIVKIGGHKNFMATACPGRYFPLDEMKTLKYRTEETEMIYNYIDDNTNAIAEDCNECLQHLVNKGYLRGDENGNLNLTLPMIRLLLINYRAGLYRG